MIGPLGFAVRSLRRRGFHSILAFLGLTLTITSTTFLLLLGESLAVKFGVGFLTIVGFGLNWLVTGYLMLALAFVLIAGLVSASHLVSSMVNQRLRDIGVIKAAGALPNRLFSYAFTEALLVFASSCIVGGVVAIIVFVSWAGSLAFDSTRTLIGLGVPLVSFFLSYLAARRQMLGIIKTNSLSIISSELSGLDLKKLGKPVTVRRLGSPFNLASRTLSRDRKFMRIVIRVSVCIFLTTVVLFGAVTSWDTSKTYLDRALPSDTLVIGDGPMVNQYSALAESYSNPTSAPQIDFLNPAFMLNLQTVNMFRSLPGIVGVDARLLVFDNVTGYVKAHFANSQDISGEATSQDIIPQQYTGTVRVLLVGVSPNETIQDWATSDGFLQSSDSNFTMVAGDSLLGGLVQMPFNLSRVDWLGHPFDVKSALVDPLNAGRVLYAPIQTLQRVIGTNGTNILLVRTDGTTSSISAVQQLARHNGLAYISEAQLLSVNQAYIDNIWSYLFLLPILTLALTCGVLLSYLTSGYSKRFNDYVALKVLGAKARYTFGLMAWEALGTVGICVLIGLPLALLFSVLFVLPTTGVQFASLELASAVSALVLILAAVLGAFVYSRRLRLMTVKDLRY